MFSNGTELLLFVNPGFLTLRRSSLPLRRDWHLRRAPHHALMYHPPRNNTLQQHLSSTVYDCKPTENFLRDGCKYQYRYYVLFRTGVNTGTGTGSVNMFVLYECMK